MQFKAHTEPMNLHISDIEDILQDLFCIYNSLNQRNMLESGFEIGKLITQLEIYKIGLERKELRRRIKQKDDEDYDEDDAWSDDCDIDEIHLEYKGRIKAWEEENRELKQYIEELRKELIPLRRNYHRSLDLLKSLSNKDRIHSSAQPEFFGALKEIGLSDEEIMKYLPGK